MGPRPSIVSNVSLNTALSAEDRAHFQDSHEIQRLLRESKVVAVVGLSTEKTKASNMVASYLLDEGYTVVPVHPKADEILGQKCFASLAEIPFPVDIVDVFRPAAEISGIVDQAIAMGAKAVWTQLRIIDLEAAQRAKDAGLAVIVDKCIKMEHGRYNGNLHWAGMNTEIVSARRRTK